MPTFSAGFELGHYRIVRPLGSGGMADVYEAEDTRLGRRVALKVLPPEFSRNPELVARFEKEVRAAAVLNHRSIVTVFEVGHQDAYYFYSMRLLTGGDLRRRIEDGMKPLDALVVLRELADAFVHAHGRGFVHRDVKPENIVFDEQDLPVLTDFGIAKALDAGTKMTKTGMTIGTPRYLSPEQARGKPVDARADIYSMGVILFEMLSGKPPYDAEESVAVIFKHVTEPVPALPDEVVMLQPLLNAMMEKEPDRRIGSCDELIRRIDEVIPQFMPEAAGGAVRPGLGTRLRTPPATRRPGPAPAARTSDQPTVITAPPEPEAPRASTVFGKARPPTAEVNRWKEAAAQEQRAEEQRRRDQEEARRREEAERAEQERREQEEARRREEAERAEQERRDQEARRKQEEEETRRREQARKKEEAARRKRESEERVRGAAGAPAVEAPRRAGSPAVRVAAVGALLAGGVATAWFLGAFETGPAPAPPAGQPQAEAPPAPAPAPAPEATAAERAAEQARQDAEARAAEARRQEEARRKAEARKKKEDEDASAAAAAARKKEQEAQAQEDARRAEQKRQQEEVERKQAAERARQEEETRRKADAEAQKKAREQAAEEKAQQEAERQRAEEEKAKERARRPAGF